MGNHQTRSQEEIREKRAINVYLGLGAIVVLVVFLLLLPFLNQPRSRGCRPLSKNHLKIIGLAFHNYHDDFGMLPDEATGESWETQLLPYLDQAPLYHAMDHTKAWSDPVNDLATKQTIEWLMNPVYHQQRDGRGYGLSHYAGNSQWLAPGTVLDLHSVPDGTANTILAGEIGDGFTPWAQPGNLRDPSLGFNTGSGSFGHPRDDGGVQFLLGDGSVRYFAKDIDPAVLKALSTPAGGEMLPPDF